MANFLKSVEFTIIFTIFDGVVLVKNVLIILKKDAVLCAALLLAVLSLPFAQSASAVLAGIDFRTLLLLFALMAVMKGFQSAGVFSSLAGVLLSRTKTSRQTAAVLILLCFFTSMLITNDVALITFVPFAIEVLTLSGRQRDIPLTLVMQTIAANLGSMLTPIGNPQNLYLFSVSGMTTAEMLVLMLPYWALSLALVIISLLFFKSEPSRTENTRSGAPEKAPVLIYSALFILCLLSVVRVLHYAFAAIVTAAVILIYNRTILKKVDYSLLLTFIGFFVFIANIGGIESVKNAIVSVVNTNVVLSAIASSQIISNVPAAILLSGFTGSFDKLLIGTNLGGLGTLIASMASLISYKFAAGAGINRGRYLALFTVLNLIFLTILAVFYMLIS